MLESASQPVQGTMATVVSLVTLVIVSMGMFSELQDALNLIWRIQPRRVPHRGALSKVDFILHHCDRHGLSSSGLTPYEAPFWLRWEKICTPDCARAPQVIRDTL